MAASVVSGLAILERVHRSGTAVTNEPSGRWLGRRGLNLSTELLEQLLPFALVLEADTVRHACASVAVSLNQGPLEGRALGSLMRLVEPFRGESLNPADLPRLVDRPLRLEANRLERGEAVPLTFGAQLLPLQGTQWLLALSPLPASLEDLHRYGLTLQDLPLHDPFRQTFVDRLMADGMQEMLAQRAPLTALVDPEACCLEDLEALLLDGED